MYNTLEKYFTAIGKVVYMFQQLELIIKDLFPILTGINEEKSLIITADLRFTDIISLIEHLSIRTLEKNPSSLGNLQSFLQSCRKCNDARNDILHSYWLQNNDESLTIGKYRMRKKTRNYLRGEMKNYTVAQIDEVSNQINKTISLISNFAQLLRV